MRFIFALLARLRVRRMHDDNLRTFDSHSSVSGYAVIVKGHLTPLLCIDRSAGIFSSSFLERCVDSCIANSQFLKYIASLQDH